MRAQHLLEGTHPNASNISSLIPTSADLNITRRAKVRWYRLERLVNRDAYLAGLDSYQILNPQDPAHSKLAYMVSEIVVTRRECLSGKEMLAVTTHSGCVPDAVPLRSGFKAECACDCDHSYQTINCRPPGHILQKIAKNSPCSEKLSTS